MVPAVSNASCAFVFVFSVFLLKERITVIKVFALVLTIAGVCMSTLFGSTKSSDDTHPTVFGYILATVVAMAYALWEV